MIIENHPTREQWLAARRTGIGASDCAAILGQSTMGSPFSVYAEKVEEVADDEVRWVFLRGHGMEAPISKWLANRDEILITDPGEFSLVRSKEYSHVFASLDRVIVGTPDKVLQIKSWSGMQKRQWDDGPPLSIQIQVQHELYCAGLEHGVIAVSIGGAEPECFDVVRNDRFIKAMLVKIHEFWERVQERRPPDPDDSEATRTAIGLLYNKPNGTMVAFPFEFVAADERLVKIKRVLKKLETAKRGIENTLKAAIGNHEKGVLESGFEYTLKTQTRAEHVVKGSTFRVLRRKETK